MGERTSAVRTTNPNVTGYWRHAPSPGDSTAELWLYSNQPELGFNAHLPSDIRWINPDSTGSRLIRHAIYWQIPIEDAIAQLQAAVTEAPDGATMLVVVHSKEVCVDHKAAGDRLAVYRRFAEYVRRLAEVAPRIGRVRVLYWQVYNEANYPGWTNVFGGPAMVGRDTICAGDGASDFEQGQRYAELLREAYPAIKQATHDSGWVVMSALASMDSSTDVYSNDGRYAFVHGMYANGAKNFYDIAAIQPYGKPGVLALRRVSDFDRALAVYGDETRPMFMTEFGSKEPVSNQWPDLYDQIKSARATRNFSKAFIFVMCSSDEPYSMRLTDSERCDGTSPSYRQLQSLRLNASLYGPDSTATTDIVIPESGVTLDLEGSEGIERSAGFVRVKGVTVSYREPTRIRFTIRPGSTQIARPQVEYRAFVDHFGWTEWVTDSTLASAADLTRSINAMQMRVVNAKGYSVAYSVRQGSTWFPWVANGDIAGDTAKTISGIRATIQNDPSSATVKLCYAARDLSGTLAACSGADIIGRSGLTGIRHWLEQSQ